MGMGAGPGMLVGRPAPVLTCKLEHPSKASQAVHSEAGQAIDTHRTWKLLRISVGGYGHFALPPKIPFSLHTESAICGLFCLTLCIHTASTLDMRSSPSLHTTLVNWRPRLSKTYFELQFQNLALLDTNVVHRTMTGMAEFSDRHTTSLLL